MFFLFVLGADVADLSTLMHENPRSALALIEIHKEAIQADDVIRARLRTSLEEHRYGGRFGNYLYQRYLQLCVSNLSVYLKGRCGLLPLIMRDLGNVLLQLGRCRANIQILLKRL